MSIELRSAVSLARDALGSAGKLRGQSGIEPPRFELFHAANSICSQKVRSVLSHHAIAYVSHPVNLSLGQTYLPEYVRLRMIGCGSLGRPLAAHHSGSTSTRAGGCDGAVVPTLIDWKAAEVVVDSRRICLHLDRQMADGVSLRPTDIAADIDEQLDIVDNLPNYQMLMGRASKAEDDTTKLGFGSTFSMKKVGWCDLYLQRFAADATLAAAYSAKRAKELSAANELFSDEAMASARSRTEAALLQLESTLERSESVWLFGDAVTLADLFWGVELLRMENMGVASFWKSGKGGQIKSFKEKVDNHFAIRAAVTDFPGALY